MSSGGVSLPWARAKNIAARVSGILLPHVVRSKCAGSVRRRRKEVSDIEFVVEPRMMKVDLFGQEAPDLAGVEETLGEVAERVKGGDRMLQYTHLFGLEDLTLELYLVHPPAEWGSILAIRTGPSLLGRIAMTRMARLGRPHRDGHVKGWPTPTEGDFFRAADLLCLPPPQRDGYAYKLRAEERAREGRPRTLEDYLA